MTVFPQWQNNENQNCHQPWQNIQMYGPFLNNPNFPETTDQFIRDLHYILKTLLKYEYIVFESNLIRDKKYSISIPIHFTHLLNKNNLNSCLLNILVP